MKVTVLTLFPEMFENYINSSIVKRAREKGHIEVNLVNFRDYADNKHKSVDDYPYGGGAGMVLTPQPIAAAIEDHYQEGMPIIYLTPRGKVLDQKEVEAFSKEKNIMLLCGHYEGVDQRIIDRYVTHEISIGDYILSGGELGALVLVDAVARLIPGVIKEGSLEEESISSGLLEYHQYTRPRIFEGMEVPAVLCSGNHQKIASYRQEQSVKLTLERRPDLIEEGLKNQQFSGQVKKLIESHKKSCDK